ncbi:hypothetical protein I7I48_11732 [Histoplasma ohiense]|nr:hypothetical protein I7I48_11732 [Histoplasma ohiense (nom. inval.)]
MCDLNNPLALPPLQLRPFSPNSAELPQWPRQDVSDDVEVLQGVECTYIHTVFTLHFVNTARRSNTNLNLQQCADRCECLL